MSSDFANTALTGIEAASYDLGIISNDIANVNTIGYKSSKAMFHDLYAGSDGESPGMGVGLGYSVHSFEEGSAINTGKSTNFQIAGDGFFELKDGAGASLFTKAGDFSIDQNGYFVNPQGLRLQGYQEGANSGFTGDLRVDRSPSPPQLTKAVSMAGNLSTKNSDGFGQTVSVYDKAGDSHSVEMKYKYDSDKKSWSVTYKVDGEKSSETTSTIKFGADGKIVSGQTFDLSVHGEPVKFDFSKMTGYGSGSLAGPSASPDGFPPGNFINIDVEKGGKIYAQYSNGKKKEVGTIALAKFSNINGLKEVGNNNWTAGADAGSRISGAPGTQGLGAVNSGVLEGSNVNLSGEFVDMISAQRDFQSNAKVIKAAKTLDQTLIDI